ncbi:MAG: phosphomannomutase/phosphoglucomutase [Gemmatimonadota bacterium]|jgi:phosphomannomutase/phosphoglucomutase
MTPAEHIFRQYDIRGIVGDDLTEDVAEGVGRAYATLLRERTGVDGPEVVTGYDNRPSSPRLSEALVRGLTAGGARVVHVGTAPTPVVYWAEKTLGTDGCVQITGSHNPPEWNGIKMTVQGRAIYGDTITGLRDRIVSGDLASGDGSVEERDVLDDYVADVTGRFEIARPVRVAVDCGNGTASVVAVELLEALGAEVTPLYCESDGTFPNHHPDPTVDENLAELVEEVKSSRCEVGIAFDGDGDRIGVLDEEGNVVRGDLLLLLFGLDLLDRKGEGQSLVFDVKCSQVLPEVFEKAGGHAVMWKTGHSLIKEKMVEVGAPLAGELSGHICVGGDLYLGFDDALFDACLLLDLLARQERFLSELVADFPAYVSTPEIRIEVGEEAKWEIVRKAQEHFAREREVIDVDGARIQFGDGWALLRSSNTQPVIVARFEARTAERLASIREEVEAWLRSEGVEL